LGKKWDTGVLTGKKQEIMREVSRFLPGYEEIEKRLQWYNAGVQQ